MVRQASTYPPAGRNDPDGRNARDYTLHSAGRAGRGYSEERADPDDEYYSGDYPSEDGPPDELPDYPGEAEEDCADENYADENCDENYMGEQDDAAGQRLPGRHIFTGNSKSMKKQASAAYKSIAASRAATPAQHPWEALDSGVVAWADFTPEEQESIARRYAPKVKYLAVRLKARLPRNIELNDLISAGSMGLVESFSKFKPELSVKFDTYAENRIRGAMLDELRRMDWFPRSLRQKVRQLDSAIAQAEQTTGRYPNEEELVSMTGLSAKDVREGLEALQNQICFSLDALENLLAEDEGNNRGEPFAETASKEMIAKVADLIDQLTAREKLVLSLYYSEELNMREVAEAMGITEGRVSQLHSQALLKLRKAFNSLHGTQSY
jgi:RNA polymerase sigma factor for flagellar operon FliA